MSTKGIKTVIAELKGIGLDDHAIAGVLGNLEAESGWNPAVVNGSGHTGLAQWDRSRFGRLQAMAKKNGWGDPKGWVAQAKYLAYEIKSGSGGTSVKALNGAGNAAGAAKVFEAQFERSGGSNITGRVAAAKQFAGSKILKSTGTSVTGETPVAKVPGSKGGVMTWVPKVGTTTSNPFGVPGDYAAGRHTGYDISGGAGGQPIRWAPPMGGKVVARGTSGAYGNHVIIRDEKNREWLLAHMATTPPQVGTRFSQGDQIGKVGNTGNSEGAHLHIEMTAPLGKGEHWSYNDVKQPKLKFKVGANGQMTTPDGKPVDGDFKPTKGDFLDAVGMSGQALERPGNEELQEFIKKAVKGEWTSQEFTRRFKNLDWYKARAASQRQFDMLQDTDQQQIVDQRTSEIDALSKQMGVDLTAEDARTLAIKIARDGFTQEQAKWFIAKRAVYDPNVPQEGGMAAYESQLKELARDYGVSLGAKQIGAWSKEGLGRELDPSNWEDRIRSMAADANPHLRQALDGGLTLREALANKLSSASQVLGIDPDSIDLRDEKWRNVFDANGTELSDAQWRLQLKRDQRYGYGYTQNGLDEAKTMGRNLMRSMGVMSNG